MTAGAASPAAIAAHYEGADIAARVLAAFRAGGGGDAAPTPEGLAPYDHFHGRGVAATREMAAMLAPAAGARVLDIGSGIGGPARWIAAAHGCQVLGVDLTESFCAAAEALNAATGMAGQVTVRCGSALDLPCEDAAFDSAYSQNVVMNIADKRRFHAEAFRVLKPGGLLALANVGTGPAGPPFYPLPWASLPAASFLASPEETHAQLAAAGFEILHFADRTAATVAAQRKQLEALERDGLPATGWHVFMGAERSLELLVNFARSCLAGRLTAIEALVRRPA